MGGYTLGDLFSVAASGYSHGKEGVTGIIEGIPSGVELNVKRDIQPQMERRRPGQSRLTTSRGEPDHVEILTGTVPKQGNIQVTDGTSLWFQIANKNARSGDYENLKHVARPGHANLAYIMKYGEFQHAGGGAASARLTAVGTAAGAIAEKILKLKYPELKIVAYVKSVGDIVAEKYSQDTVTRDIVEHWIAGKNEDGSIERYEKEEGEEEGKPVMYTARCPDYEAAEKMIELIKGLKKEGNSIGGVIECVVKGMPQGFGEPLYGKVKGKVAEAMMMINASLGVEFGIGFEGTRMHGSEFNDIPYRDESKSHVPVSTKTNNAGGVLGGISNGMPLEFRVGFKPVATLLENYTQETIDLKNFENTTIGNTEGRHDPCAVPRAVSIVESYTALVLLNLALRHHLSTFLDK